MKATIAVICFIAAIAYSMGRLSEQQCRTPVPFPSCDGNAKLRTIYSFNNNTDQCEAVRQSCGEGVNQFEKKSCCVAECPYGKHSKQG
uniref:Putative salivary kunitz domain protein n=1 Tax=Ixodes ricinus TaxID=34613 RepID=A0A0K8RNE3_IXORI